VPGAPEAEHGRRLAELLGQERERRDADPAADEQRSLDVEPEPLAERAEDADAVARVPGPIGSIRNASSPGGARQRLIGRGSSRPGASSMKN
jgi:hypothetical protein